uniref:Pre-mRNA-processing factor 39 n=1 Tax=Anthurium amnicola TaxID=1678845 RepID=A0A1D1YGQ0_9ARAE
MQHLRLYERGLAFVGKDYLCSTLWDKCIEFEHSHKQWNHLVLIYIRSLRFPTKKLNSYYQSFKKLVAICEEELKCQNIAMGPLEAAVSSEFAELCKHSDSEITSLISDLLDQPVGLLRPKILQKILTIGEYFYQKSTNTNDKISYFEAQIWRPYFHIKPLDDSQLQVWNHYLDFVEMQGDFDWTVKLYERCLIPCANYPEFWVRYIEFMEARGGREIANLALTRASTTFLKRIPQFHQYCAKVKEQIGDAHVGHPCLLNCNLDFSSNFVGRVNQQANLEKRQGNIEAAYLIYEKVIEMVNMKQDMQTLATLYMHFARFTYVVTGDLGAAKEIFVKGISRAPYCKSLFEGLISFMAMHGGGGQVGAIDSIVGHAIVPEPGVSLALSPNDRKDVSSLFLEFVDLCGTIHEIRKAWARHMKLFQHVMRPCTSLSCNDNAIGVREKTKETNFVRDHDYDEDGIGDSNKYFLFDDVKSSKKNHDLLLVGPALASKFHSEEANNSTNGNQDQAQVAKDARKPSEQHPIEPCVYTDELLCKTRTLPHDLQVLSECPEAKDKSRRLQDSESHDDLRPSLVNLSISPPVDEQCHPDACDNNGIQMPSEETKRYCDSSEVGVVQQSDAKQTQPMISAIAESPADSNCKDTCTGQNQPAELNKVQTQQLALAPAPTNVMCPQNSVKWHQVHYGGQVSEQKSRFHGYVQSEQHQQWQVPVQLRYPHSGFNSQIPMAQTYAGQPQIWQANSQMANQPQGLYQRASSQVYPSGAIVLQAPNMQQDSMAGGGQPQLVTQMATQTHVYQHPLPSNGQHNYFQGGHGASNQFWHYYQQQQQQQPPQSQ